ncbi:MAG: hypothetical protein LBM39_02020 [Candidatus Methanoplasma sp.]|jgi:hypothetical protein|nr:hypothetical protein [Candidatus Methanoplasma sp.]
MWSILGKEALYLDIPQVTKERLTTLANERDNGERFEELMGRSEIMFLLNGETEESSFFITVPDELTPDDIQFMADVVLDIVQNYDAHFVAVGGKEQRYKIIINNNKEPELLGINKTPGISSAEVFKPIFRSLDSPGRPNKDFLF